MEHALRYIIFRSLNFEDVDLLFVFGFFFGKFTDFLPVEVAEAKEPFQRYW